MRLRAALLITVQLVLNYQIIYGESPDGELVVPGNKRGAVFGSLNPCDVMSNAMAKRFGCPGRDGMPIPAVQLNDTASVLKRLAVGPSKDLWNPELNPQLSKEAVVKEEAVVKVPQAEPPPT